MTLPGVRIRRLAHNPDLPLPAPQTTGSAGHDVASAEPDFVLGPGERRAVGTGLAFELPVGLEMQVRPRSGLALRHGLTLPNAPGTIDADYRGELKVIMQNGGGEPVTIRRFARQVARLARDGWRALSLEELLACARGTRAVGAREVAITFDDGYRALREHAFPVLADHGFPATCSLITDHVGRMNRWDVAYGGRRFAHLTWRDAERWRARGIAFVSHTATHRRLTWLDDGAVFDELARSREAMRAMLGEAPEVVSYPFGAAGQRELALAQEAGYEAGFVLPERWQGDVMAIPRLPVYPWTTSTPGRGPLRALEWMGAVGANRCSVGTTLWQRWRSRDDRSAQ